MVRIPGNSWTKRRLGRALARVRPNQSFQSTPYSSLRSPGPPLYSIARAMKAGAVSALILLCCSPAALAEGADPSVIVWVFLLPGLAALLFVWALAFLLVPARARAIVLSCLAAPAAPVPNGSLVWPVLAYLVAGDWSGVHFLVAVLSVFATCSAMYFLVRPFRRWKP